MPLPAGPWSLVSIAHQEGLDTYPEAPYHPSECYPEFQKHPIYPIQTQPKNSVYALFRTLLYNLGLDKEHWGTPAWNPFRGWASRGDKIVLKPNLVLHSHPLGQIGIDSMLTHASVLRPLIDYLLLATQGECQITICDVPLQSARWNEMIQANGLAALVAFYREQHIPIHLLDLRYEIALTDAENVITQRIKRIRDPKGYVIVDLGQRSYLQEIAHDAQRLEITDYEAGTVALHHNHQKNEYLIAGTILDADLFINIPKLKTHRKTGVTLSMKNLIGINGDKSWIAHHRRGIDESPSFDPKAYLKWYVSYYLKQYAPLPLTQLIYWLYRLWFLNGTSRKAHAMEHGEILMEGNWHGNDTIWRTVLDLNNIIFFADRKGQMHETPQRRYLTILDGIIGMDGEGPMTGKPKIASRLMAAYHPVALSYVATHIMGLDPHRVTKIQRAFHERFFHLTPFSPEDIQVVGETDWKQTHLGFVPSKGWLSHIERPNVSAIPPKHSNLPPHPRG